MLLRGSARMETHASADLSSRDSAGEDAVREGTGAIRVYQDLVFAPNPAPREQASRRQLLLQYRRLDTAAMVMVWRHWLGQVAPPS